MADKDKVITFQMEKLTNVLGIELAFICKSTRNLENVRSRHNTLLHVAERT